MSRSRRLDCLVAGDANLDLLLNGTVHLEPGTEQIASSMRLTLGGSNSITSHNLALLGVEIAFATSSAKTTSEHRCCKNLRPAVSTRDGFASTHGCKQVSSSGTLRINFAPPSRIPAASTPFHSQMSRSRYSNLRALPRRRIFSAARSAQQSKDVASVARSLQAAQPRSIATMILAGDRTAACWNALPPHRCPFLPNEAELCSIAGVGDVELSAKKPASQVSLIVVKCGARGVLVSHKGIPKRYKGTRARAVDSDGPGINAGFLANFFKGSRPRSLHHVGMAAAQLPSPQSAAQTHSANDSQSDGPPHRHDPSL